MNRTVFSAVSATALSLALVTGVPAFAQVQLAEEVVTQLTALGINTEGLVVTEAQVLELENVLNGDSDDATKTAEINKILGM